MEEDETGGKSVSFTKTDIGASITHEGEKATPYDNTKSSSQKVDVPLSESTGPSLSMEATPKRVRKKAVKKERKKSDEEAPEATSKKKQQKKEEPTSEESDVSEATEVQNEKKAKVTDKIKAFAHKGAAAKMDVQKGADMDQTQGDTEMARRKRKSSAIEALIRPSEEESKEEQLETTTAVQQEKPSASAALIVPTEKREAEIMQEKLLKEEQEDQTLATFILDLVKKKRKEREEAAKAVLTESELFEKSKHISPLEKVGIICVLEETIAKLSILGYTHGKPIITPEIKYISLLDKLAGKEESALIDLIKSNKSAEDHEIEKYFIKLQKDRGFVEETLTLTLLEMKQEGTFRILQDIVHLEEEMVKEETELKFEGQRKQQEVNHYKALLENDFKKSMKKLSDRAAIVAKLKDEIQNILYYNGLKFKYLDHWESSRAEQNTMSLQNKERELQKKLLDFEEMTSIEVRCNAEMKAFIEEDIKNLSQQIEEWMEKYESEIEEREYTISKLKEEREEHLKELQSMTELFEGRQNQMDEWNAYKEKKRLEEEHIAHLNKMATRIQAWWRGTMVRRGLGPYRKKKRGKDKAGKGGKKGNKKQKKK